MDKGGWIRGRMFLGGWRGEVALRAHRVLHSLKPQNPGSEEKFQR